MALSLIAGLGGGLLSGLIGAGAQASAQRQQMDLYNRMMAMQQQELARNRSREEQHERRFISPMLNQMEMRSAGLYGADPMYASALMQAQQMQAAQQAQLANLQAGTGAVTNPFQQQYTQRRQAQDNRTGLAGIMAQQRQADMGYMQNRAQGLGQATQGAYGGLMNIMGQQPISVNPYAMALSQFAGGAGTAIGNYFDAQEQQRRLGEKWRDLMGILGGNSNVANNAVSWLTGNVGQRSWGVV